MPNKERDTVSTGTEGRKYAFCSTRMLKTSTSHSLLQHPLRLDSTTTSHYENRASIWACLTKTARSFFKYLLLFPKEYSPGLSPIVSNSWEKLRVSVQGKHVLCFQMLGGLCQHRSWTEIKVNLSDLRLTSLEYSGRVGGYFPCAGMETWK